jgi:hypothetical protein
MEPVVGELLHDLFESGKAWYRTTLEDIEWANVMLKVLVLQFHTEEDAALFKLTHL